MERGRETAAEVRRRCRAGDLAGPTAGLARGHAQANLVVLPRDWVDDFELFCEKNPKPCPLLERTAPGDPEPRRLAPGADIRTDLPRYRVYRDGSFVEERASIEDLWRDDLVAFLLGCSFSFEPALLDAGVPMRHIEQGTNVAMYRTNRACQPAGAFAGPLVVSMRPLTPSDAELATEITSRFPLAHGAPVHVGDPVALGIADLAKVDFGDAVPVHPGEVPVFWACGVTPQLALAAARPELAVTHAPGSMFVADLKDEDLAEVAS